jgi:uncharacterized protein YhdP
VAIPVLLLAAYVVVARQLMLLVPDYRQELEAVLEEHLGFAIVMSSWTAAWTASPRASKCAA